MLVGTIDHGANRMRAIWLGSLLVCALMTGAVRAEIEEEVMAPVEPAHHAVDLIPVPQIPNQTEVLQQSLRRISQSASPDPIVSRIEADLPAAAIRNRRELERTNELLTTSPTLDRLGDFEDDWVRRLNMLRSRRDILSRRASSLEAELAELDRVRGVWLRTFTNAKSSRVPSQILSIVSTNREQIEATAEIVRQRRAQVLTLLTAVTEDELEANAMRGRIANARGLLRARILEPDSEPLWTVLKTADAAGSGSRIAESMTRGRAEIADFASRHARSVAPIVLGFIFALMTALFVREHLRAQHPEPKLEGQFRFFERPVSAAIVATVLLAAALYPDAPRFVRDCIGLLLVVPLIRLLLPFVSMALVRLFGVLVVLQLSDRARNVVASVEFIERAVFFGEMMIAAVIVGSLLRSARLESLLRSAQNIPDDQQIPFLALHRTALKLIFGTFVFSAFANVFGYVALSKVLGEGTLGGVYMAIIAYAVFRVLTALVAEGLESRLVASVGVVRANADSLARGSRILFGSVVLIFWSLETLDGFEIREPVVDGISAALSTPLQVGALSIALRDILAFPLTLVLAYMASRAIRSLLDEDVYTRVTLARGVENAVSTTTHYVLLLGGFFLALGAAGIDLGRFTILAGAFGVGIGFGLQNVVNNFVSGLILLFERPIQAGDHIQLDGLLGEVQNIGIRASTVLTFQGAEVIVPNGDLLAGQLINWTLSNRHRRVEIPVGVAYGHRPTEVIPILRRVLDREDRILTEPAPSVLFRGFGDSSLNFEIRFWARDYLTYMLLTSDVASAVYDELERAGITIPFPQRDLHLKSVEADVAKRLRGDGDATTSNEEIQ